MSPETKLGLKIVAAIFIVLLGITLTLGLMAASTVTKCGLTGCESLSETPSSAGQASYLMLFAGFTSAATFGLLFLMFGKKWLFKAGVVSILAIPVFGSILTG